MPSESFIGSVKAAEMLGVSLRTVQLWVERGVLRAWKTPGGHRKIALKDIEAQLQQRIVESAPKAAPFKVLIVEDIEGHRKLYKKYFASWNLPVEISMADNSFSDLIKMGEISPHLLITDLMMPGMDGVQMIKSIRENPELQDIEIVVVTAMGKDSNDVKRLQKMGLPVTFTPIPFDEVKRLIEGTSKSHLITILITRST